MRFYLLNTNHGFINWLQEHMLACPFKKYLHIDCPGCGFQRSVVSLFKGDVVSSLQMYPATLPIFALLAFVFLHIKFKFEHGALVLKTLYIICAAVILVSYIYKIITKTPA